jgi:hypothetical protein
MPEVADRAFELRVREEQLDGSQVACLLVYNPGAPTVWLPTAALRSNFVAARLGETENRAQDPGNLG